MLGLYGFRNRDLTLGVPKIYFGFKGQDLGLGLGAEVRDIHSGSSRLHILSLQCGACSFRQRICKVRKSIQMSDMHCGMGCISGVNGTLPSASWLIWGLLIPVAGKEGVLSGAAKTTQA